MVNNNFYTKDKIEKLGNAIIYLTNNIRPLYKTKLLKLIYLIEEVSIKKHGIPFFGFDFQLWRLGPVVKDVFIDLSSTPVLLEEYITTTGDGDVKVIYAKKEFSDDEFSDLDMQILDTVVNTFKDYSAKDLVEITHREHFPWHTTAKNLGYLDLFDNKMCQSTDIVLDLSMLLDNSPELKNFYLSNLEFQKQSNHLKGNF
jgi:uncharacterized phage-associated protein